MGDAFRLSFRFCAVVWCACVMRACCKRAIRSPLAWWADTGLSCVLVLSGGRKGGMRGVRLFLAFFCGEDVENCCAVFPLNICCWGKKSCSLSVVRMQTEAARKLTHSQQNHDFALGIWPQRDNVRSRCRILKSRAQPTSSTQALYVQ